MKMVGSDTGIHYKTIDNFLNKEDFKNIKDSFITHDCAWYYSTKVGTMNEIDNLNNSCDGFTILEHSTRDPEKRVTISSIENRLLLFKADTPHRSTSCTDQKFRMNININYI